MMLTIFMFDIVAANVFEWAQEKGAQLAWLRTIRALDAVSTLY